jgi:hypothetical protein
MLKFREPRAGAGTVQSLVENESLLVVVDLGSDLREPVGALGG